MGEASLQRRPRGLGSELARVRTTLESERMNPDAAERFIREPRGNVVFSITPTISSEQHKKLFDEKFEADEVTAVRQRLYLQRLAQFSRFPADVLRGFIADIHQNALALKVTPPPIDIEVKPDIHQYYAYNPGTKKIGAYYEAVGPERYEEELERYYTDIDPFTTSDYD